MASYVYEFQQLEFSVNGVNYHVDGRASIHEDPPFSSYGCYATPGSVIITRLERLDADRRFTDELDWKSQPAGFRTVTECCVASSLTAMKSLNDWFAEKLDADR